MIKVEMSELGVPISHRVRAARDQNGGSSPNLSSRGGLLDRPARGGEVAGEIVASALGRRLGIGLGGDLVPAGEQHGCRQPRDLPARRRVVGAA
ncbi:MAG: hypothetical protein J0H06_11775 [Actinobacteria bacterium]|nr:hypothetical protein [Actinomycetota bacterium]